MRHFIFASILTFMSLFAGVDSWADDATAVTKPKLSAEQAKLRKLVVRNSSEASYQRISWRTSVLQGIVEAQRRDQPVMIYLMNGHPLGCT